MKALSQILLSFFIAAAAAQQAFAVPDAAELKAQRCLDTVNFELSAFSPQLLAEIKVAKNGCKMKFIVFRGKGERLEVDLCQGDIRIEHFTAIDESTAKHYHAGSAHCPNPLFGADFSTKEGDSEQYAEKKQSIQQIFRTVQNVYGKEIKNSDDNFATSGAQLACSQKLLEEYLENCLAREAAPKISEEKSAEENKNTTPGIHPATIVLPKK